MASEDDAFYVGLKVTFILNCNFWTYSNTVSHTYIRFNNMYFHGYVYLSSEAPFVVRYRTFTFFALDEKQAKIHLTIQLHNCLFANKQKWTGYSTPNPNIWSVKVKELWESSNQMEFCAQTKPIHNMNLYWAIQELSVRQRLIISHPKLLKIRNQLLNYAILIKWLAFYWVTKLTSYLLFSNVLFYSNLFFVLMESIPSNVTQPEGD